MLPLIIKKPKISKNTFLILGKKTTLIKSSQYSCLDKYKDPTIIS